MNTEPATLITNSRRKALDLLAKEKFCLHSIRGHWALLVLAPLAIDNYVTAELPYFPRLEFIS